MAEWHDKEYGPPRPEGQTVSEHIESGLGTSRFHDYDLAGYAVVVTARMPKELWSGVFFSWLSLKGHIQGMHGMSRTQTFASRIDEEVHAVFVTVWDEAEVLDEWVTDGYPVAKMLSAMGVADDAIDTMLMRDYS